MKQDLTETLQSQDNQITSSTSFAPSYGYYDQNRDKINQIRRERRLANVEQARAKQRLYRAQHKDRINELIRINRQKNLEQIRDKDRKRYAVYKDRKNALRRKWRLEHLELFRERDRIDYQKNRIRENQLRQKRRLANPEKFKQYGRKNYYKHKQWYVEYYQKNREKQISYSRQFKLEHKAGIAQKRKEAYHANPDFYHALGRQYREKFKEKHKADRDQTKLEVYSHYCDGDPKCACCGVKQIDFLTIDHVDGRHKWGHSRNFGSWTLNRWLRKNLYPMGFQVLCYNCNYAKHVNGVCPHLVIKR